uniref:Galactosyltransferase N-terminal domain-containing protein n=1 Tax=Xiphophorus maculatus TaxID=8083 RepID=A0A3B5PPM1_XIPMA
MALLICWVLFLLCEKVVYLPSCLLVCLAAFSLVCFALFLFHTENRKLFSIASLNRETNPEESAGPTGRPGKSLDPCADVPPNLQGVLQVEFRTNRTLQDVRNHVGPFLQQGGRYRPTSCRAKQKVAVIIPFRNRYEHLTHWLYYLHPVLMRQQLDYGVYVINQDGDGDLPPPFLSLLTIHASLLSANTSVTLSIRSFT